MPLSTKISNTMKMRFKQILYEVQEYKVENNYDIPYESDAIDRITHKLLETNDLKDIAEYNFYMLSALDYHQEYLNKNDFTKTTYTKIRKACRNISVKFTGDGFFMKTII